MKNLKLPILLIIILMSYNEFIFAQGKKANTVERVDPVVTAIDNPQSSNIDRDTILEENIRRNRLAGNKQETERLQNELSEKYKLNKDNSEIKIVSPVKANLFNQVPGNDNLSQTNLTVIDSLLSNLEYYTLSEQLGPNKGRIWTVYFKDDIKDTIKVVYSDDNGINWQVFAYYPWAFPQVDISGNIDAEIAINTITNDKMLFIVLNNVNVFLNQFIGVVRIDVGNHPGLCSQQLFNYGGSGQNFYAAHVTCDNASFTYMPYIHIASYEHYWDSFYGTYVHALRYAVIVNTFDVYAPINFPSSRLITFVGYANHNLDMCAFLNQGIDYVFFVDEDIYTNEKNLRVIQYSVYNALTGGTGYAANIGNFINKISDPHVSSDGSNLMIVCSYEYSSTDYDIQFFTSSSGIYGINTSGFIDNSLLIENAPRITSEFNGNGRFFCCYKKSVQNGFKAINLCHFMMNQFNYTYRMVSNIDLSNFDGYPGIPARLNNNECFVIVGNYYNTGKIFSSTGCSQFVSMTKTLKLKLFIEGFYRAVLNQMSMNDTVKVYLRNITSPYGIIDSAKVPLAKTGKVSANFANAQNNVSYFLSVKHRNSIETWSKAGGVIFSADTLNYDFSVNKTQAYGNNQKLVDESPLAYAIFSGDVNGDGTVDARDLSIVDNDAINFATGYRNSDVSGDNVTDATDLGITDNNAFNFVSKLTP